MIDIVVIHPEGTVKRTQVEPTLEKFQRLVGGYIEPLEDLAGEVWVAYTNEEGKLKGLPVNRLATAWCWLQNVGLMPGDWIAGPMVVLGPLDHEGNDTSVRPDVAAALNSMALDFLVVEP